MRDLPFVDAHVHLWDLGKIRHPWLEPPFDDTGPNGSVAAIARNYLLDDYRADAAGRDIRGIVHVDAGAEASAALDETIWLQEIADTGTMPIAIVAFAALDQPDVGALLAAHARHPNVRGIRQIVNWHPDTNRTYTPHDLTRDAAWERGYALLAKHGLSFDLQAYPAQFPTLAKLLARHPETPVIINHAGMAIPSDADGWDEWRTGMAALAALPHVHVKISGMGFVWRQWTEEQIRPYVLETITLFGPDRAMFASDVPTDKLFGSLDRHLDAYDAITADLAEDERRALWGRTANRVYRLGLEF